MIFAVSAILAGRGRFLPFWQASIAPRLGGTIPPLGEECFYPTGGGCYPALNINTLPNPQDDIPHPGESQIQGGNPLLWGGW